MKGIMSFGIDENGKFFFESSTQRYITEVEPTEYEAKALAYICEAAESPVKLFRRSSNYLTICNEAGNDFCRLKATEKALWFSVDMWTNNVADRPSLSAVQNKNQRHWKINLNRVEDIALYSDVIAEASR